MLSPKEYVCTQTHKFPILYARGSYDISENSVFEQLFNVIGNGIRDHRELVGELSTVFDATVDYDRYWSDEPLYIAFTELDKERSELFGRPMALHSSKLRGAFKESEKDSVESLHDFVKWEPVYSPQYLPRLTATDPKIEVKGNRIPYPNFKKEYSIVWKSDFKQFGLEWVDAATRYYKNCVEFFKGDCLGYSSAYPEPTPLQTENRDRELKEYIESKEYPDYESVSRAYGVEYTGDIKDFQIRRWAKEKERILDYLDETLSALDNMRAELEAEQNLSLRG